jgi:diaminobutyrate-2-oxoglutarate transaminase
VNDADEVMTVQSDDFATICKLESRVRIYCRGTPIVFKRSKGSEIYDESGNRYIDLMSAAGSLNYGHNNDSILRSVIEYLEQDGILQSLDFATSAKASFLESFNRIILGPRNLRYRVQFTGPTGTNAVEAAIKLARKVTGRTKIAAFTNAYHGVSLGSLALTGNRGKRSVAGVSLNDVIRLPYDGYMGLHLDAAEFARKVFEDPSSGFDLPAAFIVETVQGEGGLNVASQAWLQAIATLAKEIGALLIIDDIQAGCGRTGPFFSFEDYAGVSPDIVCMSKSISGCGFPMALTLIRPELDVWEPGDHNGTFRGNNLAFISAGAALGFWSDKDFERHVARLAGLLRESLDEVCNGSLLGRAVVVGKGLFLGLRFQDGDLSESMRRLTLKHGVLTETSGPKNEVLKIMPPLTTTLEVLHEAVERLKAASSELDSGKRM